MRGHEYSPAASVAQRPAAPPMACAVPLNLPACEQMLSEPGADFEGGDFCTLEADGKLARHPFERGDLLIFNAHKYHWYIPADTARSRRPPSAPPSTASVHTPRSVQPVTSGHRRVLVSEIWEGLPRRCVRRCNTPWGVCECEFAPPPPTYASDARLGMTKLKPCLRLMSKSDDELAELSSELAQRSDAAAAAERCEIGSHCLWRRRQAIDKARRAQT